jgi:hypothetical protein
MQKMMYLLVSQHVSGIIMPIIRRMVPKPTTPVVYITGRAAVDSWRRGGSVCTCWDWSLLRHKGMSYNRDAHHTSIKSFNKIKLIIVCFGSD